MTKGSVVATMREREDLRAIRNMPIKLAIPKRHAKTIHGAKSPFRGRPPIGEGNRIVADIVF